MNKLTIVERSSGFWVVDNSGVVEGPFSDALAAQAFINVWESQPKE